jgi:glutathione S-transferase
MSDLVLYIGNRRYSSWSVRPYLALCAARADFRPEVIVLDQPATRTQIKAVNPAGRVPVLHDGRLVIHDSLAICEYIAERFPDSVLWPRSRSERARARSVVCEMHAGFAALRRDMPQDLCASKPGVGHTAEALADAERIFEIWRALRGEADSGPYLFGTYTIADAFFTPVAGRFKTYGGELDATCQAYADALLAYPPMAAWIAAAGLEAELTEHK